MGKKAVTFLKKSNQKTFDFRGRLRGHGMAAQKPGTTRSFLRAFDTEREEIEGSSKAE
jgi:hypothetical protein